MAGGKGRIRTPGLRVPGALVVLAAAVAPTTGMAQQGDGALRITLERGTRAEARMAVELWDLLDEYDVEPWILTRDVVVEERAIPHSHPVLTVHTRHLGDELHMLTMFVHEQLHWLEEEPWLGGFEAAMADFEEIWPDVPPSDEGGARDAESVYRHLLLCDLELQAMTALVGEEAARRTLSEITHYEWIYERVLNDPRVREVALRHGFDVSKGVPGR